MDQPSWWKLPSSSADAYAQGAAGTSIQVSFQCWYSVCDDVPALKRHLAGISPFQETDYRGASLDELMEVKIYVIGTGGGRVAVSSTPRPWIDVFALLEKFNMVVIESDPEARSEKCP